MQGTRYPRLDTSFCNCAFNCSSMRIVTIVAAILSPNCFYGHEKRSIVETNRRGAVYYSVVKSIFHKRILLFRLICFSYFFFDFF